MIPAENARPTGSGLTFGQTTPLDRPKVQLRSFDRAPTDTVGEAVDRKIEWLKKTDPELTTPKPA